MRLLIMLIVVLMPILSSAQNQILDSLRQVIPSGFRAGLNVLTLSPDNKYILAVSEDGTLKLFDYLTFKELNSMNFERGTVKGASFCPDSKKIIFWGFMSSGIIDVPSWKIIRKFQGADFAFFSKDSKKVFISDMEGFLTVYDILSTNEQKLLQLDNIIHSYHLNAQNLFVSSPEKTYVFDKNNSFMYETEGSFQDLSHDNQFFSTVERGEVNIYETKTGKKIKTLTDKGLFYTRFSPDQNSMLVISGEMYTTLSIYDLKTGKKKEDILKSKYKILSASYSPDGSMMQVTLDKCYVNLYDLKLNTKKKIEFDFALNNSEFSKDSRYLIIKPFTTDNGIGPRCFATYDCKNKSIRKFESKALRPIYLEFSKDNSNLLLQSFNTSSTINFERFKIEYINNSNKNKTLSEEERLMEYFSHIKLFLFEDVKKRFSNDSKYLYNTNKIYLKKSNSANWVQPDFVKSSNLVFEEASFNHDLTILSHQLGETLNFICLKSGLIIKTLEKVNFYSISNDAKTCIVSHYNNSISLYDLTEEKTKLEKNVILKLGKKRGINKIVLSPDKSFLYVFGFEYKDSEKFEISDSYLLKYDLKLEKNVWNFLVEGFCSNFELSLDGKMIMIEGEELNCKFLDSDNGNLIQIHESDYNNTTEHYRKRTPFSPDGNYIITQNEKKLWITNRNTSEKTILNPNDDTPFESFWFSGDGKYLLIVYSDLRMYLWDCQKSKHILSFSILENNNYFIQLPNSPYYMCSKEASKMLHYVTPSLKVIGFEQLDPIYNRPDIVLDSIGRYFGNNDRGMIEEYRKAWEKRIERLGLKDQMDKLAKGEISVPNAVIENAESIAYENTDGVVKIQVKANDSKYKLRRFNVWVNEVPLYGSGGISIAGLNKNEWDTTLSVALSLGDNKIQVSVMNELGLENFKYPLYVKYNSDMVVPKTHYIGIGVDKFDNGKNLSFCVKDIKDLGNYFSKLPNSSIKLLTEKEVNKENITKLKEYLKTTSVHDRVIISCSSHGILDSARNFYLATHDTDFESPSKNGISFELLDGLLDEIPARKKLLLLDACNSGENDEGYAKMDNSSTDGRGANVKIGDEIVKESNFKKMKELFVNVRNNSGAYIISATGGIQKALEGEAVMLDGKPLENGSFTYAVLEYLKENESSTSKLTVNQLKKYVEQRVVEITNGKQTPTSRQETMEIDWDLK